MEQLFAPPRAGKLAPCNRSPGGRQVLGALAAGSDSSVAEAPSTLHRLPASSPRAQGSLEAAPQSGARGAGPRPVPDLWVPSPPAAQGASTGPCSGPERPLPSAAFSRCASAMAGGSGPASGLRFPEPSLGKGLCGRGPRGRPHRWSGNPQGLPPVFTPCNLPRVQVGIVWS